MPRYRVIHRTSGEEWEVEAPFAENARLVVGWPMGLCRIVLLRDGPFANIVPPKVAVQISQPKTGRVHICPDCKVTMLEKIGEEFWWECPSCNQLYHEWENKLYSNDEIDL